MFRVFLVIEGELPHYYESYVPHGIFSDRIVAEGYARQLVKANESQRWDNVAVMEFELNRVGQIEQGTEAR